MSEKYTHVFSPMEIRGVRYKNRLELAPPGCASAGDENGLATPKFTEWFRQFAWGGTAILSVGNCSIDRSECFDEDGQLDMRSDACIEPLAQFAAMCLSYGAHGQLELNHNGVTQGNWRTATPGQARYGPSAVITDAEIVRAKLQGREPAPTIAMSRQKIEETIEKFALAALRCKRAGMKTVMFHGAHGNLLAQFFSPYYNRRTDEYGGSIENRARFAAQMLDAVRAAIGEDMTIEYRLSGEEFEEGHTHFRENLKFIDIIKDKIDILHVSGGLHDTQGKPHVMRPMVQPYTFDWMFNVHWAADIKKQFPNLPVTTVGSIKSIAQAEEIIASGKADFVAFVRALFADPEMPRKFAEGREEDHRPCVRCACVYNDRLGHMSGPCTVNPLLARGAQFPEGRAPAAPVKKRVAVIGGGPAGIQAMLTLIERGHDVTLYEKTGQIGGNIINAAALPVKKDIKLYLAYLKRQAKKVGAQGLAKILLNTQATPESIAAEGYDSIIVAIGSVPTRPEVPGADLPHVHWAPEAESGSVPTGERIIVVGAGGVGVECATHYAKEGKKVTLAARRESPYIVGSMSGDLGGQYDLLKWLEDYQVDMRMKHTLLRIEPGAAVFRKIESGEEVYIEADTVLFATGMRPLYREALDFTRSAPATNVFLVGDCAEQNEIRGATRGAFEAARQI